MAIGEVSADWVEKPVDNGSALADDETDKNGSIKNVMENVRKIVRSNSDSESSNAAQKDHLPF